jgi:hypothetical protein
MHLINSRLMNTIRSARLSNESKNVCTFTASTPYTGHLIPEHTLLYVILKVRCVDAIIISREKYFYNVFNCIVNITHI